MDEREGALRASGQMRLARIAGISLLSLTVGLVVAGAVFLFGGDGLDHIVWGLPGVSGLWAMGFSGAGFPITRRHPANPVGWSLMVAGVAAGASLVGLGAGALDGLNVLMTNGWVVSVGALSSAVVLFPSGRPPSRLWWAQLAALWSSGVLVYFQDPTEVSGFIVGPLEWLDPIAAPVEILFQISLAAGLFSLFARWRRSGPVERTQIKWVVYGAALVGATALVVETGIANLAPDLHLAGTVVLSVVILAVPVTIGVAMLRYRLYDIDIVINRTLVYSALTLTLAGIYFGGVAALQRLITPIVGEDSQLTIVASTLAIAALFNPLRRRIQTFVDRRFYRRKYDAAKVLRTFSATLRDETDLEALSGDLRRIARETMQPVHVSVWLRDTTEKKA